MISAATIELLLSVGVPGDRLVEVARALENDVQAQMPQKSQGAKRQARYRERHVVTSHSNVTAPPIKETPPDPLKKTTPLPTSKATPSSSVSVEKSKINDFERFWSLYPERKGANPRKPAKARFESHLAAGVDAEELIAGARAYAADMAASGEFGTVYVAQTVTWLNQERWRDKPRAPPSALAPDDPNRSRPPGAQSYEEIMATRYAFLRKDVPDEGQDRQPQNGEVLRGRDGLHREDEGDGRRSVHGDLARH